MNHQEGDELLVVINGQTASVRTRRLLRQHGPRFVLVKYGTDKRAKQLLFSSLLGKWTGWLPEREVTIMRTHAQQEE
jgi:hypothetical protein